MWPKLFQVDLPVVGPIALHSSGTLLAIGYLTGLILTLWRFRNRVGPLDLSDAADQARIAEELAAERNRAGRSTPAADAVTIAEARLSAARRKADQFILGLGILCLGVGVVGGKLLGSLLNPDPDRDWQRGYAFYGGFIPAILVAVIACRLKRVPPLSVLDSAAVGWPIALGMGRLGCFLNGCCFGTVCSAPWGVSFPTGSPAWEWQARAGLAPPADGSLPVQPVQLYEAVVCFGLAAAAWQAGRRKPAAGWEFIVSVAGYCLWRFFSEPLRAEAGPPLVAGLTLSKILSAALLVAVFLMRNIFERRG